MMNNNENENKTILDIPKIKENITEKHNEFMSEYGSMATKVEADYILEVEKIYAKLNCILWVFKQEGIVDFHQPEWIGGQKQITLFKYGYSNSFKISVDGKHIVLYEEQEDHNAFIDFRLQKKVMSGVLDEDFDWVELSNVLLTYIHKVIYNRQKVIEKSVFKYE